MRGRKKRYPLLGLRKIRREGLRVVGTVQACAGMESGTGAAARPQGRRDKDNISAFGRKVIQDALVKAGYLLNDGWDNIEGFEDHFYVDAKQPRIVVEIWERDETDEV